MNETNTRRVLGAFLRAHRERLAPASQTGGRRRTPGLRREEVAEACGVGVTWITWLEQGRDVSASPAALARLAGALRLSPAERTSMFDLAGKSDPAVRAEPRAELPAHVLDLPSLFAVPAYLLDHGWTARAWNAAGARLFIGWLDAGSVERNLLRFVFLSPAAQELLTDWARRARRLVAEFRADYSRRPGDRAMQALIDDLSERSELYRALWREQEVLHREGGERIFHHPVDGPQHFIQTTLLVASHSECKLVCLAPAKLPTAHPREARVATRRK
jgi:transcriptional regulator with XRE-family HTH domain